MLNVNLLANPVNPNGLAIQFPYDKGAVDQVRLCLGLSWDKSLRVWKSEGPEVLLDMERFAIQPSWVSGEARQIAEEFRQQLWNVMDLRSKDYGEEEFAYQQQGAEILAAMPNMILGDSPGAGKSKQVLDALAKTDFKHALVVCPNTLVWNWATPEEAIEPGEIFKWHPEFTEGVVPTDKKKRAEFWKSPLPQITVCNYEKLYLKDWPVNIDFDVIIADEIHRAKNSSTATYKALRRLINRSKHAWGLTGTPFEIRIMELYNILGLLRPAVLGNFMRFRDQHCETDWAGQVVGVKNMQLLRERIAPFMLRRDTTHPRNYQNIYVQMTPAESNAYQSMTSEFDNWLAERGISGKGDPLVQLTRMRQFVCTPAIFTDELGEGSKFHTLKESLDDWRGKVVIFSFFEEAIAFLHKWLKLPEQAIISGKVKPADRRPRIDAFNRGELGNVLVSTDAGREGLNITGANLIIHYDQGFFNPQKMQQREGRLDRIGQKDNITVINMLCMDTIDVGMYQLNKEREKLFKDVIDGAELNLMRKLDAPALKRLVHGKLNRE